jgi:hypothetical protein
VSEHPGVYRAGRGADRTVSHTALVNLCRDYLWTRGAWCAKIHGHLGQLPGMPDLIAALPVPGLPAAVFVGIECKTGAGRLETPQKQQRALLEQAGAVWVLARQLEDLEDALYESGLIAERSLWPRRGELE